MKKMIAIALVLMLCVSALSISAFAADTVKVTAEVPADWTVAYCYYWGGTSVDWPGVKMTKSGSNWTVDIPANSTNVIISIGDNSKQTVDLAVEAGKDVTVVVGAKGADGKYAATVNGSAPAPAPTPSGYYVTGEGNIFGNWAECNEAGKMTESNGIYVKEFTGVAAGAHKLKVNVGDWSQSWGGSGADGNFEFNVAEDNSTVTVKFNPADSTVTVEVNGAGVGQPAPAPTPSFDAYFVAGTPTLCNGKEWDPAAAENAMTKGDDGKWSITYTNVPAGEYELKVTAGDWNNCWGLRGENVKFTLEEEAAEITVRFNPATGWVSVYNGENPLTNDVSLAGIGIALLAATAGVVALVGKKKEF